jgi:hypothetical protein
VSLRPPGSAATRRQTDSHGAWIVSCQSSRVLSLNQAITALTIAELLSAGYAEDDPLVTAFRVLRTQAPRRGDCRTAPPGDRPPAVPAVPCCRAREHHGQAVNVAPSVPAERMSQRAGRSAAHCPGWPLQRQGHPKIGEGEATGPISARQTSAETPGLDDTAMLRESKVQYQNMDDL